MLVANLNTRNEQLRTEVAALERELADARPRPRPRRDVARPLARDLARVRAWAGVDGGRRARASDPVAGPIGGAGVEDLLNELRNAGAEAIAVEGVRVVAGASWPARRAALTVEGAPARRPVRGPGHRRTRRRSTGTLTRVGGVVAQLGATYPRA